MMFPLKNPDGGKIRKQTYSCDDIASLKPSMRKLESKTHIGKRVQCDVCDGLLQEDAPPDPCKSLSRRIPIPLTHLRNVEYDRDLVNKSARLSHDLVCKTLISPLC